MARTRGGFRGSGVRDFTAAEVERIRVLTFRPVESPQRHSSVQRQLDEVFEAAGRKRGFVLWLLGGGEHDPDAAFAEEMAGGMR